MLKIEESPYIMQKYLINGGFLLHKNIRRKILIVTILSIIFVMAGFLCANATTEFNATGKIKGNKITVRKTASTKAKSVVKLKNNTELKIKKVVFTNKTSTAAKYKWYYVEASPKKGYVRSDYVDSFKYTKIEATTTDGLNYRKGAGTKMKKVGTYKKGKTINLVLIATAKSDKATWYQVEKSGKYYFVNGNYVKIKVSDKSDVSGEPVFTKTDIISPSSLEVGTSFNISGNVTCDRKIVKAKIGILDAENDWIQEYETNVGSKSFDIAKADNDVHFGRIMAGSYKLVGHFYVDGKWYKKVINKSFTITADNFNLTDKIVKERIQEIRDALEGTYFTTDGKPCRVNDAEPCNVCKVITENKKVKNLIKTNKGSGKLNTALFPYHYNPFGVMMILGWSCCGFAGFAGWYVGADDISSNVDYVIVKKGCKFEKKTFDKYARVGDLVRTRTHSFMVLNVKDDGCEVIDSNWGCTCNCSVHTISWEMFKNVYDVVTISRATTRK